MFCRSHMIWLAVFSLMAAGCISPNNTGIASEGDEIFGALNDSFDGVVCRMTIHHIMYADGTAKEESACIPIVKGKETDQLIPLFLPAELKEAHNAQLKTGTLYVAIKGAQLQGNQITLDLMAMGSSDSYQVVDGPPMSIKSPTSGGQTLAIVRVSTSDSWPSASVQALEALFRENEINIVTQYKKCSVGKLKFRRSSWGVVDITVPQPVSSFGTGPGALVDAAQKALIQKHGVGPETLANKVFFCLPPGTGSWVASAGLNHWRSQYNDGWCTSLTTTMHEMGHQIGLLHSNKNFMAYEDRTGYMARGYKNSNWPLRCFNGQNHDHLGWYNERKYTLDPRTTGPKKYRLAAFVDFQKTTTAQPVLINLAGKLFLQYNRAKSFNEGTGEMQDLVTIVTEPIQGGTQLLTGLGKGQSYAVPEQFFPRLPTGQSLVIKVCSRMDGNGTTPDIMAVGIGTGACNLDFSEQGQGPLDNCPHDPNKTEPGICGCGTPDTDSDYDNTPDCFDHCPHDPQKTEPAICGCGTPDTDTNNDNVPDCNDQCPHDPLKNQPGICGCGTPDSDIDNDAVPDCIDYCPHDPLKNQPGICGCGMPETDADNDSTPDCYDACPNDPKKILPGECGCHVTDTDSDNDHTPDCHDGCPYTPFAAVEDNCKLLGTVECWGDTEVNGIGLIPPPGEFALIDAHSNHTCLVASNNEMNCWSYDVASQSLQIPPTGQCAFLDVGRRTACCGDHTGAVKCLGDVQFNPKAPGAGTGSYTDISTGGYQTCAIDTNGAIVCNYVIFGLSVNHDMTYPPAGRFTAIDSGHEHTCALATTGEVSCWGWNSRGQLDVPAGNYLQVAAGFRHTCVLDRDRRINCVGANDAAQSDAPPGLFVTVTAGRDHTCALDRDWKVHCWGKNDQGQSTPPPNMRFFAIAAGDNHTCGLRLMR